MFFGDPVIILRPEVLESLQLFILVLMPQVLDLLKF